MGRRLRRLLSLALLGATPEAVVALAEPAAASCMPPTVEYGPLEVEAGGTITVRGTGFGTDCHDSGPPPAGQGALGKPAAGIEVLVVQAEDEHLVARGSADADYEFEVDVPVPAGLASGDATIVVRLDGGAVQDATGQPVRVTAAARPVGSGPSSGEAVEVVAFGPVAADDPVPVPDRTRAGRGRGPGVGLLLVGGVLLVVIAAGFALALSGVTHARRERTSETGPR